MSKSKASNIKKEHEALSNILAAGDNIPYWGGIDGTNATYNNVGNSNTATDTVVAESEIFQLETTTEPLQDFNKCLNGIQDIIQSYTIGTLNYRPISNNEYNTLSEEIILTRRESEILYYLSQNKSIKDIAAIASILDNKEVTARTINAIIDKQLYKKFGVDNIEQLVEKADALNMILFQPEQ
ncbi:MAG: hypothetical protein K0R14_48 [Burkholderiales bacterium]|jgi:DNA-binding CsgD family transcriptional regulator|nr:hypothetical protein [Burkholderiales bacterium]